MMSSASTAAANKAAGPAMRALSRVLGPALCILASLTRAPLGLMSEKEPAP